MANIAYDFYDNYNLTDTNVTYEGSGVNGYCRGYLNSNSRTVAADSSVFDFDSTDAFTFSLWFKRDSLNTVCDLLCKQNYDNTDEGYYLFIWNNKIWFYLANTSTNAIKVYYDLEITDNEWNYLVITYDGSSQASGVKFYLNNVNVTLTIDVDNLTSSSKSNKSVVVGNHTLNLDRPFSGYIDEFGVWNRVLTPQEVTALYNDKKGLFPNVIDSALYRYEFTGGTAENLGTLGNDYDLVLFDAINDNGVDPNGDITPFIKDGYVEFDGGSGGDSDSNGLISNDTFDQLQLKVDNHTVNLWVQNTDLSYGYRITPITIGYYNGNGDFTSNEIILRVYSLTSGDKNWYLRYFNNYDSVSNYIYSPDNSAYNKDLTMLTYIIKGSSAYLYLNGSYVGYVNLGDFSNNLNSSTKMYVRVKIGGDLDFKDGVNYRNIFPYKGKIFKPKIFNQVLNPIEIKYLYDNELIELSKYTVWNGLIGYYDCEDTGTQLIDKTGNGNDFNSSDITFDVDAKINKGIQFAGTDTSNLTAVNSNIFNFSNTDSFTYSFWTKPTAVDTYQRIITKGDSGFQSFDAAIWANGTFECRLQGGNTSKRISTTTSDVVFTQPNIWYFCTITYDGSSDASGLHLYVNGIDRALNVGNNTLTESMSNSYNFMIGRFTNSGGQNLTGLFDEFGVWNRALTPYEVKYLYNNGDGVTYTP